MPTASPPSPKPQRRKPSTSRASVLASARKATQGIRVGRPLSYSPDLCERAVALGKRGKSWAGIAAAFNISRSTLNEWERLFPEFSDALARARAAAQSWWEDHGRRNLKADRYQAQVHKNIMAAQFEDYREAAKAGNSNGLDLGALVGAISQGVAAATLQAGKKDDAPLAAQDVVPSAVEFAKTRE